MVMIPTNTILMAEEEHKARLAAVTATKDARIAELEKALREILDRATACNPQSVCLVPREALGKARALMVR